MRKAGKKIRLYSLVGYLSISLLSSVVLGADSNESTSAVELIDDNVPEAKMLDSVNKQFDKSKHIEMIIGSMIENARKEIDTVRILCLDDKLTQIQSLAKGIQNRVNSLKMTLEAKDSGAARHQFVIIQVSFNKLEGLRVQADACVGNSDFAVGASESDVSVDKEYISTEDATTPGVETFSPEPQVHPTVASGYR